MGSIAILSASAFMYMLETSIEPSDLFAKPSGTCCKRFAVCYMAYIILNYGDNQPHKLCWDENVTKVIIVDDLDDKYELNCFF